MTIDNGAIRLESFEDLSDELVRDDVLTDDEQTLLDLMGHDGSFTADDAGSLPSFSRAAQVLIQAAEASGKTKIDGVIAVDPMFLQSMLGLTSGITASDGTKIDGTNLAALLLALMMRPPPIRRLRRPRALRSMPCSRTWTRCPTAASQRS